MYCGDCGAKVDEKDSFCASCGKSLVADDRAELYSFGPWGTGVCFSRPGFLTLIQKNNTKIMLTNDRLSGYSMLTNSERFQIPYKAIVMTEIFDYLLWKVLWIQYQEGQKKLEVSIMGTATNHQSITMADNFVKAHRRF
jgi:hypothetical protein